jgi:hypothetical protein
MSRRESEADAQTFTIPIRDLRVTDETGDEISDEAVINLDNAHVLHFKLELDSEPASSQYRVTVVIHKRGRSSWASSGEIRNARLATTFTHDVTVFLRPPRLEFDIIDTTPDRFHDGPGPYETTIALTPMDSDGKPIESQTSTMSYDFVGAKSSV